MKVSKEKVAKKVREVTEEAKEAIKKIVRLKIELYITGGRFTS